MTAQNTVLIVDDETYWLERACRAAKACGLEPITARNFGEATTLLNEQSFPLIITDNSMAGNRQAGLELMQYINARSRDRRPIILHSSEEPKELKIILEVFPHAAFVKKDIVRDDAELIAAIRLMLD